ncbi:MAG TPA: dihydroorotase [Candidatus Limnocylindrales bacterium]|nr:dihydroorotase [Candidatus Limnocylindrales bacterium]
MRPGQRCQHLELGPIWLVDPSSGREGVARLRVEGGRLAEVDWARAGSGARSEPALVVLPGLTDLHVHLREPGGEDAESVASGLAAAAHGGFTTVCAMANTTPPGDDPAVLGRVLAAARQSGSPVRLLPYGTISAGRAGLTLAPLGELADAGAAGFSDDGAPVADPALLGHALAYAGGLGLPVVEHAEDSALTEGAEMSEGLTATLLGLRGWPAAGEEGAVARALAVLADVARGAPPGAAPRLHLTHLSTAGSVALVRAAKAAHLPVTCDVTPHHLALYDGWVAGDRRFAWDAVAAPWQGGRVDAAPFDPATRVNPPLRSAEDALALWAALADGTVDAIATDHAPHREVDKRVEYGTAAPGISGLETALSLILAGVEVGLAPLLTVARALTMGPQRVLAGPASGSGSGSTSGSGSSSGSGSGSGLKLGAPLAVGEAADLVVVDRASGWTVDAGSLRSKGHNTPLLGRALMGRVLLTVAAGRLAYLDPDAEVGQG